MEKFSQWLQKRMDMKGWNQAETARALDVSRTTVTDLMAEKYPPSRKMIEKISKVFGVSVDEIVSVSWDTKKPLTDRDRLEKELLINFALLDEEAKSHVATIVRALVDAGRKNKR